MQIQQVFCHCEERRDEAIPILSEIATLPSVARNDGSTTLSFVLVRFSL